MSINAIGTTTPWQAAQVSGASAVTSDAAAAASSTSSTNASGLGNFFQQFAADLQSMLTQLQATSGGTSATTTPGTTSPATPSVAATTANATPQASTEQSNAVHHHHHHHDGGGGRLQNAANQFVGQLAQAFGGGSGNAVPAAGTQAAGPSAAGTTTNGANTLATDIVQALQNYGAFSNASATSTISTTV